VDWRRHALPMLALWAFALLAYSNSFRAGLSLDNAWVIQEDSRIQAATSENARLILTQDYSYKNSSSGLYRPVTTFSYLLNYAILGGGSHPAGYHWVNFALHAVNILLVYWLGLLLFQEMGPAWALAAVWALHPILTESVTNIVGRADLLAGFGVLAGLVCHAKSAAASGRRKLAWLLALMLAATIGMFSKESAVVLLAAMVIYDFTLGAGGVGVLSSVRIDNGRKSATRGSRADEGVRPTLAQSLPGYVAVALPLALFLYVRSRVFAGLAAAPVPFTDNPLAGAGFWTARLTAVKVIGKYLWLLVWPRDLSCDYSYNQIPLFAWRFGNGEDAKAVAALAVCVAAAAVAIRCYRRHKPVCFLIAFFFAALAPTSNLVILIGTIMAERFLYLASVGFAGCLVWAIYTACRRLPPAWPKARIAPAVLALIGAALAVRTYARNIDWLDDQSLWTSAVRVCPASYKTRLHLATALIGPKGEGMDRAIGEVDRSLAILDGLPDDRNVPHAYSVAGFFYLSQGDLLAAKGSGAQSKQWYQKALDVLLRGERVDRIALEELRRENQLRGIMTSPSGWYPVYLALGDAYLRLSDPRKAMEAFEYGRILRPAPEFFEDMSAAWRAMGDPQQAAITLIEGLLVDKSYTRLASELVDLYRQTEPRSCALHNAGGALSPNLACPLVHDQVCTAFRNVKRLHMQMGQEPMAASTGRRAVSEAGCPAER
jgi:tetratricopeptide (TPR) repeat protein